MSFEIPSEPGIYEGVTRAQYEAIEADNQSTLKIVSEKTPLHYKEAKLHPYESTKAQDFGQGWHAAILEPEVFEELYAGLEEKVDRRTKAGKAAWADFESANDGKILLEPGVMGHILRMRDAVWARKDCRQVIQGSGKARHECAVVWIDEETGMLCKSLVDSITPKGHGDWTVVLDLKSTVDASFAGFRDAVSRYDYDYQLAFYLDGLDALAPAPRLPVILAQEKTRPYAPALHELMEEDLDHGRARYRADLRTVARCRETGIWPGYPQGPKPCPVKPWKRAERELKEMLYGE